MSYIPPHKRHSKDPEKLLPTPASLAPQFKKSLNLGASGSKSNNSQRDSQRRKNFYNNSGKIVYAQDSVSRWFSVCAAPDFDLNDSRFDSAVRLEPISVDSFERKLGPKPLTLVLDDQFKKGSDESGKSPWLFVAENVFPDLLSAFQRVKTEMDSQKLEGVKPALVARFGKVLFHGLESIRRNSITDINLGQLKRSFYTNVSSSFMEHVINKAMPKLGIDFEKEREVYHIKLSDNTQPDSTLFCKCSLMKDYKMLKLHKIELNQVRHLVEDISCLDKKMDLRVMLCTKRIVRALKDDEIKNIRSLIDSAILDEEVKGGLRWPLGKESSGDCYTVIGAWHTNTKIFRSSSLRLKVRHADRFDFRTSFGEVTREVVLKMKGIVSQLQDEKAEIDLVSDMLKNNLQIIWDNFICHGSFT